MQATYCVIFRKNTGNKNAEVFKTRNGRLIMKSICNIYENKKSRFVSKSERSGILSSLGIRTPLSKILGLNNLKHEKRTNDTQRTQ